MDGAGQGAPAGESPARESDVDAARELAGARDEIQRQIEKRIIGQKEVVDRLRIESGEAFGVFGEFLRTFDIQPVVEKLPEFRLGFRVVHHPGCLGQHLLARLQFA